MPITIVPIVEGHGEVSAVPVPLRRVARMLAPDLGLHIPMPIRVKRDRFLRNEPEFRRVIELACLRAEPERGGVLVLLDSDGQCDEFNGPSVRERARRVRSDRRYGVVFAHHEFETWFAAAADSLAGRHLAAGTTPPAIPESVRGSKGWVRERMIGGRYVETIDQARLTAAMDIAAARTRSPSLDKLCREVSALLQQ